VALPPADLHSTPAFAFREFGSSSQLGPDCHPTCQYTSQIGRYDQTDRSHPINEISVFQHACMTCFRRLGTQGSSMAIIF